jgi:hypothetical protein
MEHVVQHGGNRDFELHFGQKRRHSEDGQTTSPISMSRLPGLLVTGRSFSFKARRNENELKMRKRYTLIESSRRTKTVVSIGFVSQQTDHFRQQSVSRFGVTWWSVRAFRAS